MCNNISAVFKSRDDEIADRRFAGVTRKAALRYRFMLC